MSEPANDELQWISTCDQGAREWFSFVESLWNHDYGKVDRHADRIILITGGWSDNEAIVSAMQSNTTLWSRTWYSSTRGGRCEFRLKLVA
jgi:hypothetical protein